jgi:[calcium/calmodulin-dependent protein kinase] kinase
MDDAAAATNPAGASTPRPPPLHAALTSPTVLVQDHDQDPDVPSTPSPPPTAAPILERRRSASFVSPARHHKRTPSVHRDVKETLDAKVEFASDETDGRTHHRINQYTIHDEIGRGSFCAVHLGKDQFGNEYVRWC